MSEIRFTKQFEIKLAGDDSGAFEVLCSVFGNVDSAGDVVEPGAFSKTISERGRSVPILWMHNPAEPIGVGEVFESGTGLAIKGRILSSVGRGREALALLREGVIKGMSIGYQTMKEQWDSAKNVRRLLEVKLFEVSIVLFPRIRWPWSVPQSRHQAMKQRAHQWWKYFAQSGRTSRQRAAPIRLRKPCESCGKSGGCGSRKRCLKGWGRAQIVKTASFIDRT